LSLVAVVSEVPFPSSRTVTFAFATAAPCGSVTEPRMPPYTACACAGCGVNVTRQNQIITIGAMEICFAISLYLLMCSLVQMCRTIRVQSLPGGSRKASEKGEMSMWRPSQKRSGIYSAPSMNELLLASAKVLAKYLRCQHVNAVESII